MATAQQQLLQELFILATGRPANTSDLATLDALAGPSGNFTQIDLAINSYMRAQQQSLGLTGAVQAVAKNGFGMSFGATETNQIIVSLQAAGIDSWSKLFHFLAANQNAGAAALNNRAEAASHFSDLLQTQNKSALYAGASVNAAVGTLVQGIDATGASLAQAKAGLAELAANLTAEGIMGYVADGYLAGATVFADANGNDRLDAGEWSDTTDGSGNFVMPLNAPPGKVMAMGGTDIMTGESFLGVLAAPPGSIIVNPLTTLVQVLVEGGSTITEAATEIRDGLGLPGDINPLTYDPLQVLATGSTGAQNTALGVQAIAQQIANLISMIGTAVAATNAGASRPAAVVEVARVLAAHVQNAGATTPVDLSSLNTINAVIEGAPGVLTAVASQSLATIVQANNDAAVSATTITELAKAAVVAQGDATAAIASSIANDASIAATATQYSGANLDQKIDNAETGLITPEVPVPNPTPSPSPTPTPTSTFTVVESSSGTVTFDGSATGDISVAVANGTATFMRDGITATTTVASVNSKTIKLNGSTLLIDAADAAAFNGGSLTLAGDGTLKSTETLRLSHLQGVHFDSLWSGKIEIAGVEGTAAQLANDSRYLASGSMAHVMAGSAAAADLLTIDNKTSLVVDAAAVSAITGSASEVMNAYLHATGSKASISGLGDETVTVSGAASAADVQTILAATTGAVSVGLEQAYSSTSQSATFEVQSGDKLNIDPTGTVTALNSVAVATANEVDAAGEWHFDANSKVFTWRDTKANATDSIILTGAVDVVVDGDTVTVTSGEFAVNNGGNGGAWTISGGAGNVTLTTSGSDFVFTPATGDPVSVPSAQVQSLVLPQGRALKASLAILGSLQQVSGDVVVDGSGTATASTLAMVAAHTSGDVDATGFSGFSGSISELSSLASATNIDHAADFDIIVTGNAASAADIYPLTLANGNGAVNLAALESIDGTASELALLIGDSSVTRPTNFASTVTGTASAADIATLAQANGTGSIKGSGITALSGTAAAVVQALADINIDPTTFDATLTGMANAADVSGIAQVNGSGTVNGAGITALNGTASAVLQAIADIDTDPTNFGVELSGDATVADIVAVDQANGTGDLSLSGITKLSAAAGSSTIATLAGGATFAESLDASANGSVELTLTVAQYAGFTDGIGASGFDDTITFTDAGNIVGDADIKTYVLAAGNGNKFSTAADDQRVKATALLDGQSLTLVGPDKVSVDLDGGDLDAGAATGILYVKGGMGSNVITTGSGNDRLEGGGGADALKGGDGNDIFVFAMQDVPMGIVKADTSSSGGGGWSGDAAITFLDGYDEILDFNPQLDVLEVGAVGLSDGSQGFDPLAPDYGIDDEFAVLYASLDSQSGAFVAAGSSQSISHTILAYDVKAGQGDSDVHFLVLTGMVQNIGPANFA